MASQSATDTPDFIRLQNEFAAHIRDPDHRPAPPGIEDRRMGIYRELFYNNVESFMSGSFPVLRKLMEDEAWHSLIRAYFAQHRSRTPLFTEMPREFLAWLEAERGEHPDDPPYLRELAHYEWVELALAIAEETPDMLSIDPDGDLLAGVPVLSPLARHLAYRYPVHRIGPDYRPLVPEQEPTFLVVYRDRSHKIGFLEINAVTKRLLELIEQASGASGRTLLERVAAELNHPDPRVVIHGGRGILHELHRKGIIPGTKQP